jgi:ornithine cyclodeaminase
MRLRILSAADVAQALPMADAIAGMKEAYRQLSTGQAAVPLRPRISVPAHDGVTLFMPAYLSGTGDLASKSFPYSTTTRPRTCR